MNYIKKYLPFIILLVLIVGYIAPECDVKDGLIGLAGFFAMAKMGLDFFIE